MKILLIALILASLLILHNYKIIDFEIKYTIIFALLLVVLTYDSDIENFQTSNEAVQIIASVYNGSNATLSNLTVNNLTVTGNASVADTLSIGNNAKLYGKSDAQDKIQLFKNSDNVAPYFFYNKHNEMGFWNGTESPVSLGGTNGDISLKGNLSVNNDLILAGANSWIFHSPNDTRRTLYIAPNSPQGWDWGNGIELTNTGGINGNINSGLAAFIFDGTGEGARVIPIFETTGTRLSTTGAGINNADWIVIAPGYGVKMWDAGPAPDYSTTGTFNQENRTKKFVSFNIAPINAMDYIKAYVL